MHIDSYKIYERMKNGKESNRTIRHMLTQNLEVE